MDKPNFKRARYCLPVLLMALWAPLASGCGSGGSSQSNVTTTACTGSSPTWTSTPDVASVSACVASASAGDTINVSAGSATWSSGLTITKNLRLIGAGIDNTVITADTGTLITYSPVNNAALFRLSGFTFDANNNRILRLENNSLNPPIYRVRIDNNRFTNSTVVGGAIENFGTRGVVDHNTFDAMRGPMRAWGQDDANGTFDWDAFGELQYGAANDNLYIEDNTFNLSGSLYMVSDCDAAGRYVYRYNSFRATADMFPWLDWHGGRGVTRSCFSGEIYGNTYSRGGFLVSWRGGRALFFYNSVTSGSGSFNVYNNDVCPIETRERHNNGYAWRSRNADNSLVTDSSSGGDNLLCPGVILNSTYYMDNVANDGTVGVGAGPLASLPATCVTGVGYWATTRPTTSLADMVGPNPVMPISGTLYQCTLTSTLTNVWTAYYTPLTYPHPLTKQ